MNRIGFQFKVKADKITEYKQAHTTVWPEMLAALRRSGWHNYSLFLRDDGLVFGYFETPHDFQTALDSMASEPINDKWQTFMAPFIDAGGEHADKNMLQLNELFHLE